MVRPPYGLAAPEGTGPRRTTGGCDRLSHRMDQPSRRRRGECLAGRGCGGRKTVGARRLRLGPGSDPGSDPGSAGGCGCGAISARPVVAARRELRSAGPVGATGTRQPGSAMLAGATKLGSAAVAGPGGFSARRRLRVTGSSPRCLRARRNRRSSPLQGGGIASRCRLRARQNRRPRPLAGTTESRLAAACGHDRSTARGRSRARPNRRPAPLARSRGWRVATANTCGHDENSARRRLSGDGLPSAGACRHEGIAARRHAWS